MRESTGDCSGGCPISGSVSERKEKDKKNKYFFICSDIYMHRS